MLTLIRFNVGSEYSGIKLALNIHWPTKLMAVGYIGSEVNLLPVYYSYMGKLVFGMLELSVITYKVDEEFVTQINSGKE